MSYFLFLFILITCSGIAFFIGGIHERSQILKDIESHLNEESSLEDSADYINIKVEEHNGIVFVYKAEDNSYMAHDQYSDVILRKLALQFPDKKFMASPEGVDILLKNAKDEPI